MYKIIGILGAIIIAIGLIWFIFSDVKINVSPNENVIVKDGISAVLSEEDNAEEIEIKQIPIDKAVKQELIYPDLNRTLVFPSSFPEDARTIIQNNVTTLIAQLETDPDLFNSWLDLATQYKIIEDYEGAHDIWEFLNIAFPTNSISFNNLGDLYHYNLKDFPKAEQNLRTAIGNDKQKIVAYTALHELYKYSYKQDTTLVTDILLEGLKNNPNNIDLLTTLAAYYKERGNITKGDITNAKKYYEQARDKAEELGNTQLVNLLNQELTELINL